MSAISTWSATAGSNNASPPNGWPEGMAASKVNDSAREMMAAIRTWYEEPEWISLGITFTRQDADTVTTAADQSAIFHVGRRVRVVGSNTGTIYGFVASVATTTIDFTFDSGSIDSGDATVVVSHSALSADSSAIPIASTSSLKNAAGGLSVDVSATTAETEIATDDAVLIYDTSATATRKITVANFSAGMDCVLVAAQTISSASEYVNFEQCFTDTFLVYRIQGTAIRCTRAADQLYFQIGAGATPTWHTGTDYFYSSLYNSSNSTGTTGLGSAGNATSYRALGLMLTGYSTGTSADQVANFDMMLYQTRGYSAATPGMHTNEHAVGVANTDAIYMAQTSNYIRSRTENTTSIRFTGGNSWSHTSAMTLEEGEIRIYGYRNA